MQPSLDSAASRVLHLHDLAKAFSGIQALGGVSFDLQAGEVHALVGENGAGKSTLIKIVAGAYVPDSGTIEVGGIERVALTPEEARQLGIGVVYQEFNLLPELSVAENIFVSAQPTGRARSASTPPRTADGARCCCWIGWVPTSIRIASSST